MFRKKWKSFVIIAMLIAIIIAMSVLGMFFLNKYRQMNSINLLDEKNNVQMQEELFKDDVSYDDFITSIQKDVKIVLITVNGKYRLSHNKTKKSNEIFEWFSTSKIELDCDYSACFVIDTSKLEFLQTESGLEVYYSVDDIYINSLTITNSVASEIKAIFGKGYSSNDVLALQNIIKEQIMEQCSEDSINVNNASTNLKLYLYELANSFNVEIRVCER